MKWYAHINDIDSFNGEYHILVTELIELEDGTFNGDLILDFEYQAERRDGRFISGSRLRREVEQEVERRLNVS